MSGLCVIELGDRPSTAYCAKLLIGLGAAVLKPVGGKRSAGIAVARGAYLDAGKELLPLGELKRGQLQERLAQADVVLTALQDDELASLGVDLGSLRSRRPELVIARTSVLEPGQAGAELAGDLQAQALSGVMYLIGEPDREPLRLRGPQAEYTAALSLVTGIMFALYGRMMNGTGADVATSAVRATAYLDWKSQIFYDSEGKILRRGSDSGPLVLRCTDGHVGFYYRPEEWAAVKRFIGEPALDDERFATQRARDEHRRELHDILEHYTGGRRKAEVYHAGQAAGIPVGAVWRPSELLADQQYAARGFIEKTSSGVMPALPWTIDGERATSGMAFWPEAGA